MFYGWRMVAVAFAAHGLSTGLGFYALPRLLVPLADEFAGGQRTAVSMLAVAISLATVVAAPIVGVALSRFPLRALMPCGAVCLGLGFAAASQATALWHLALIYSSAVPIAILALSSLGANALVANWFDRRRPLALGIAQLGLAFAGAFVTYFISWTLASGGSSRRTYGWFAIIALLAAPLLWATIRDRPADIGLHPDGREHGADPMQARAAAPSFTQALRDRNLWRVSVLAGLAYCGTTGWMQNAHAFATDAGFAVSAADTLFASISLGAALGKVAIGWLGVRFGEQAALWIALAIEFVALAIWPAALPSLPLLLGVGLAFGIALGGLSPAISALLARIYGSESLGPVLGYMTPMLVPFQMVGAPVASAVRDWTGAYDLALYGFAASSLVAALLLSSVRIPDRSDPEPR